MKTEMPTAIPKSSHIIITINIPSEITAYGIY